MGKVTIAWKDAEGMEQERVFEGGNVGYDEGGPDSVFLRAWADDTTFLVYENRVIYVHIEK